MFSKFFYYVIVFFENRPTHEDSISIVQLFITDVLQIKCHE